MSTENREYKAGSKAEAIQFHLAHVYHLLDRWPLRLVIPSEVWFHLKRLDAVNAWEHE